MRGDLGGPYDQLDTRSEDLFEQIGREKRRDLEPDDDLALAQRADALAEWHGELAEIFARAETLTRAEDGHPLEATMAHQAAVMHNAQSLAQADLARQHRARLERMHARGRRHALADPFAVQRVHAAGKRKERAS